MNQAIPDCLVTGFQKLADTLELPDEDDRHVLAAAIKCRARIIITFNLTDFPGTVLKQYGIEAQHPDEFLVCQFDLTPDAVCEAVGRLRARLQRPPVDVESYLETLVRQRLPQFAERLGRFPGLL